ncbi:MAG: slipin family protein [Candidatus Jacksonbacteria bacterium]|jgi:regulator of protease activity HflC (stomatin/prohibitin superfamily)|nr:slipin family protein [Candidatus Jacksonbacteria bacterium]MBT6034617.1 slipin family protein [Candidatus Jacksonbacteria bacterium]MBT6301018.1 slipin family protein [Candidatus Jacksonbacteria bacterium]MBT6757199.1 slipin family protein [Candidatus Jacksonbacteria bacterium]MBT6954846.1 slipin family protein [Candidatus Jacksonbacteria bacterium]
MTTTVYVIIAIIVAIILVSIRQINEYQRGVKFTLGKYSGIISPGWKLVFPVFQSMTKIDMRVKVADVPPQDTITKDNVTVAVNAVIYYKVTHAEKAVLEVENYNLAVSQLSQTTMRNIVGSVSLDEVLSNRDEISVRIKDIVDQATDPWGIKVESVELKDIQLPQDMQRTIGKQAESEREKRSVIIKAEGEAIAAENLSKAARMLSENPGALHLRTLQSINDISSDQSNTVVFAVPLEVLRALESVVKKQV